MDLQSFLLGVGATAAAQIAQLAISARTVQLAGKRDVTDTLINSANQMKEGLQLLESDKVEIRIGALHDLGLIARSVAAFHEPVVDILCAYVRRNAIDRGPVDAEDVSLREPLVASLNQPSSANRAERSRLESMADIDTALRIIGVTKFWNSQLRSAKFSNANATEAMFLACALESASFDRCNLELCRFVDCDLSQTQVSDCQTRDTSFGDSAPSGWML